jgi:fermentation-respiration switch protein FrsA (DUF1100 family)
MPAQKSDMQEGWPMNASARYLLVLVLLVIFACSPSTRKEPIAQPSLNTTSTRAPSGSSQREKPGSRVDTDKGLPAPPPAPAKPTLDELLLFFPSRYPRGNWQPKHLDFADVWFTAADKTRIHGWYCPHKDARAVVLYAHGNGGNLSDRGHLLAYLQDHLRVSVLIFDYRGYGRSEGTPSVAGILQDARAARAFLARHAGVKESEIVLMGRSLGGAVVAQLAGEKPPRGLVLESTFSSLREVASHHYPRLAWLVPANKLDSVAQLGRYHGPLLQSHGQADRTIPYALARKLFRAANEPKQFVTIPGGDHNDPQTAEYYKELDRFLDTLPKK